MKKNKGGIAKKHKCFVEKNSPIWVSMNKKSAYLIGECSICAKKLKFKKAEPIGFSFFNFGAPFV